MSKLITTREAAKRLDVDPSTIHLWRSDPRCPKPAVVRPKFFMWKESEIMRYGIRHLAHRRREVTGIKHNRTGYNRHHCRCAKCTAANTKYIAEYKARKAAAQV